MNRHSDLVHTRAVMSVIKNEPPGRTCVCAPHDLKVPKWPQRRSQRRFSLKEHTSGGSQDQSGSVRDQSGPVRISQGQSGSAGTSQGQSGPVRDSQDQSGPVGISQDQPGPVRISRGQSGSVRTSQDQSGSGWFEPVNFPVNVFHRPFRLHIYI